MQYPGPTDLDFVVVTFSVILMLAHGQSTAFWNVLSMGLYKHVVDYVVRESCCSEQYNSRVMYSVM